MTGRGSGAQPSGSQGSGTVSFTERYAPPKPPLWRRIFSADAARSVLTLLVAVGLIAVIGYLTWVSIERSGRLAHPPARSSTSQGAGAPKGTVAIELTSADGTRLAAWSTPSKANKSQTAVILVHDAGGDHTDLAQVAAALRDEHDVIALDLRGHGASDDAATTLGPAEAEDVRAAIDAAIEGGNERIALVGVGLGASAALAAASGDSRVDGIVAIAPWPRVADAVAEQLRDEEIPLAWPADWATLVALLFRTGRDVTGTDVMDTVTRTTAPILVVGAGGDPLTTDATLRTLENLAPDLTTWKVLGDREDALAVTTEDDGIARIAEFIDAAFKRDD